MHYATQFASNATLVESSIYIFLWEIPLNSHARVLLACPLAR
jgi:hypothetical protein